jgi:hypothetical protein
LSAGLLASSQYASGRSCDRSSRHRFSWFPSVFNQMLRRFPNSKLLLHASHAALPILNSSKLPPVVDAANLCSKLSIQQSEIQNSAVCLKPPLITTTYSLSHYSYQKDERRSLGTFYQNDALSPPSENKVSLTSPLDFLFESTLHLSFASLSSASKGYRNSSTYPEVKIYGTNTKRASRRHNKFVSVTLLYKEKRSPLYF